MAPSSVLQAAGRLIDKTPAARRAWDLIQLRASGQLISRRRRKYSYRYLRGEGLEIGAMHLPLPVPPSARVRYVDRATRAENLRTFPSLDPSKVIDPDIIEDGFALASVPDSSQDFLIACHVLEHSSNPVLALENWWRVLRPNGALFLVVPLRDHCFDRGRVLTTVSHLIDDYDLVKRGDDRTFAARNLEHYVEWTTISEPNLPDSPKTHTDAHQRARELAVEKSEIHFHTFSIDSFRELLQAFGRRPETPATLVDLAALSSEVLGVLLKVQPRSATEA